MQLSNFTKEATEKLTRKQRAIIFELAKSIVMDSPVDRGTFRGNWRFSFNHDQRKLEVHDRGGGATLAELQRFIDGFNGGTMWLLNGMPYGLNLEYGSSRQAPGGMVRRNVSRINAIVARIQ
ncbi:MAG: hypothetical protein ACRCTP_09515 [Aeromonas popoffii]|uniref:hypothetical protein n=1 Tax=Aeromonas popoffii TaxID=70856 RepID=UPI003F3C2669